MVRGSKTNKGKDRGPRSNGPRRSIFLARSDESDDDDLSGGPPSNEGDDITGGPPSIEGEGITGDPPSIDDIIASDLTPAQLEMLAKDRPIWERISNNAHLNDWRALAPGLQLRRQMAMKIANTNQPKGRRYNTAMSALLERDGLQTMNQGDISNLLWLHEEPERVELLDRLLATMTAGQRSRINSPKAAKDRVQKAQVTTQVEAATKKSRKAAIKIDLADQLSEKTREVDDLKERLAAADAREPPFNFQDKVEVVGTRIIREVPKARLPKLIAILTASLKTKTKQAKR